MPPSRTKVIACATVIEEMLPLLPPTIAHQTLEFGLHVNPDALREALQAAIDASSAEADTIILGYGLCSRAVAGLRATNCRLIVPRVHDCIAIFLGSHAAYDRQSRAEPGTYYLTKGWIEAGDTLFSEYDHLIERHGRERAEWMTRLMLKNYTRLAFINTGQHDLERYREHARRAAARFELRYEEIKGSTALVKRMIYGPWEDQFVVIPSGQTVEFAAFLTTPVPDKIQD